MDVLLATRRDLLIAPLQSLSRPWSGEWPQIVHKLVR